MRMLYTGLGTNALGGIALDPGHGDLYWARTDGRLQRGSLDGHRLPETVLAGAALGGSPTGLALQRASGTLVWIAAADLTVRRAGRAGQDARVVAKATAPTALEVENAAVPEVGRVSVMSVTATSARLSAVVTAEGDAPLTARGVVVAPRGSEAPAIGMAGAAVATASPALGAFTVDLAGLPPHKAYVARAFATNVYGTAYGPAEAFAIP
jgi:hypothetical protein